MKQKVIKHGFMLIELLVATAIASMVAGILLTALAQGNRFQLAIDNMIDTSLRFAIVSNQLEKDLMGAFIPAQAEEKKEEAPKETANKNNDEEKVESNDKKTVADKKTTEKKEQKIIEKIFYSTNKEGNLDTLTFISNNPLIVFVGKDVGVVKPNVVRIQYTLKLEEDILSHYPSTSSGRTGGDGARGKKSYALFRQESTELDLAQYKDVRPYEVIGGIRSCVVTFTARTEKKQEQAKSSEGQASQEPQERSYEYKTSDTWVSEQKKEADKKQTAPRIPFMVEFKMILWDMQNKREQEFTFACEIPTDMTPPKQQQSQRQQGKSKAKPQGEDNSSKTDDNSPSNVIVQNTLRTVTNALGNITQTFGQM